MNIFVLNTHPVYAAQEQCDKHIVKMVLESGQMLSTAHRILDGELYYALTEKGRKVKRYRLSDDRESVLYKAVHFNHPCTVWTMENSANYTWHYTHFQALAYEFEYRFEKPHQTWLDLRDALLNPPNNIPITDRLTKFKLAMGAEPQCINEADPVSSYQNFYVTKQKRFEMSWSKRQKPTWFIEKTNRLLVNH